MPGARVGSQPATAVSTDGTDRDNLAIDLQLDALPGPSRAGGHGVQAGPEGDQGVLADPAQVCVGDQIGLIGQWQQGCSIGFGAHRDDLAVGAVDLGATDRQPTLERTVGPCDRVEGPAGDHVVTHDQPCRSTRPFPVGR